MNSKYNSPLNLGSNDEISIIDLARIILKILKKDYNFSFKESIQDEPKRRCPDLTDTFKNLNWKPKISLHDGLELTINYFKDILLKK